MTRASFGSATRHIIRQSTKSARKTTPTTPITTAALVRRGSPIAYQPPGNARLSGQANDYRARREILDDEDAGTPRNGIFWIHGVGVERLTAAADRQLHLPQPARSDGCRYETNSANDLLVTHGCTLIIPRFSGA